MTKLLMIYSMKKYISLLLFITSTSFAGICPDLSGAYHCMTSSNEYYQMQIDQKLISETNQSEMMAYSFEFSTFPGDPDIIHASAKGEMDSMGWLNKCARNKLISMPLDGSMLGELYLDEEKALVRTLNGNMAQRCPRKITP
jgi:hypothetical protein